MVIMRFYLSLHSQTHRTVFTTSTGGYTTLVRKSTVWSAYGLLLITTIFFVLSNSKNRLGELSSRMNSTTCRSDTSPLCCSIPTRHTTRTIRTDRIPVNEEEAALHRVHLVVKEVGSSEEEVLARLPLQVLVTTRKAHSKNPTPHRSMTVPSLALSPSSSRTPSSNGPWRRTASKCCHTWIAPS